MPFYAVLTVQPAGGGIPAEADSPGQASGHVLSLLPLSSVIAAKYPSRWRLALPVVSFISWTTGLGSD